MKTLAALMTGASFTLLVAAGCGGSESSGLKGTGGTGGTGGAGVGGGGTDNQGGSGGSGGTAAGSCKINSDCSSGVCDPSNAECVDCLLDTDCSGSERCASKQCVEPSSCSNSLDCVGAAAGEICDDSSGQCVECTRSVDCSGDADCRGNRCVPFTPCENSLDCDIGLVCSAADGRCVTCVTDLDCPTGEACVGNECRVQTPCVSDNQCTPLGQLCDMVLGICVECTLDSDCAEVQHCATGFCTTDVCAPGEVRCQGNTTETCVPSGAGYGSPQGCGARTTCVGSAGAAQCTPWVCDAGLTYCDGTTAISCATDGLSATSQEDCALTGLSCFSGECRSQLCQPNILFCDGNVVRLCDPDGQGSTLDQTCSSSEHCAAASSSCEPNVCTPSQPACDGTVATTCNATGTGYSSGGTDCATTGLNCANGSCTACVGETILAEPDPVSIYIMLDTSCSMGGSRLTEAKSAINAFVLDPSSAGLGVALDHFPQSGSNDCDPAHYTNPDVGMGTLPGNRAAITSAVNGYAASGGTPTFGAVSGVTSFCNDYQTATGIKCVGIVVSDGFPESNDCLTANNTGAALNAVAANGLSQWDVNTFTMGLSGLNTAGWNILHGIAQSGGTDCDGNASNSNFACDASSGTQSFIQALNAIRAQTQSCSFALPQPSSGTPDWAQVVVTYTPGGGTASELPRVATAAGCSGAGWYYDNNSSPTSMTLCPTACASAQADPNGQVAFELPCGN